MILEACVESFSDAVTALVNGANRIELCDNLAVGGTTPSLGTLKMCHRELQIPVVAMIRPRGGDFCYTDLEFEIMKEDLRICKSLGIQGVVFGILKKDKTIDLERTRELAALAGSMETVFHKAFDEVPDTTIALHQLMHLGITRILTSGTEPTALQGKNILNTLLKLAGDRITILVAGNVTSENLKEVSMQIPAREFHGRKIVHPLLGI